MTGFIRNHVSPLRVAGVASLAAGVIHSAAVGVHAEHVLLSRLFVALAVTQIAGGLLSLVRGGRLVAVLTALVNVLAVVAWAVTRTTGIAWIDGLEHSEPPQFTDTVCAVLAAIAVLASVLTVARRRTTVASTRLGWSAAAFGAVTVVALMLGAKHAHPDGGHADGEETAAGHVPGVAPTAAATHHHHEQPAAQPTPAEGADPLAATTPVEVTDHTTPRQVAYDPAKPIDLSGLDGVTPEQQAFAENVVAENVLRLPQWADPATAEVAGYHSLGDAVTGHEHYVNWDLIEDQVWLDPDQPESLVYELQPDGRKQLVSAMYILPSTTTLADVPDWGGRLMQWHIHNDICLTTDPETPTFGGLIDADGNCPAHLQNPPDSPMIHVWITPHPCGPFGALEGIAAGQVLEGEEHFCDHVHGQQ